MNSSTAFARGLLQQNATICRLCSSIDANSVVLVSVPRGGWSSAENNNMIGNHGRFVWYELLTTDVASAEAFYHQVLGWDALDASTPQFTYRVLTADAVPMTGLMALPPEGVKRGAAPR